MAKYAVYYRPSGSFIVTVEIPDSEVPEDKDELVDKLIDEAYDIVPYGVCAQCSGWGQNWSLDFGDSEVYSIEDSEGNVLLDEKP